MTDIAALRALRDAVKIRQSGDLTLVREWPVVWAVPHNPPRKRFIARKVGFRQPHKFFPTQRAALDWVIAALIATEEGKGEG